MHVYDFDKTISVRDSTEQFVLFCLRHHPHCRRYIPRIAAAGLSYAFRRRNKTQMKEEILSFLAALDDVDATLEAFWDRNIGAMHRWYAERQQPDDVVVSASPEFLLRPACIRLGIRHLIASRADPHTGAFDGLNCHGAEKVLRFRALYPTDSVEEFYSDSLSDSPLASLARRAYLVQGETLAAWPEDALVRGTAAARDALTAAREQRPGQTAGRA